MRLRPREEAARAHEQDGEEDEVPGEVAPADRDLGSDRLRDPEHDAAGERAPERAESADDHRLERRRSAAPGRCDRVEARPDAEEDAGDRGRRERHRHRDARRACGCRCPTSCAVRWSSEVARSDAAEPRVADQELEADEEDDGDEERDQREPADRDLARDPDALRLDRARRRAAAESAENCSSRAFWMMIESPNVARIGASPLSSVKLSSRYWSAKPSAAISGMTSDERRRTGSSRGCPRSRATRNAARTIRSPWARLTRRMTPKTSERPVAKSA